MYNSDEQLSQPVEPIRFMPPTYPTTPVYNPRSIHDHSDIGKPLPGKFMHLFALSKVNKPTEPSPAYKILYNNFGVNHPFTVEGAIDKIVVELQTDAESAEQRLLTLKTQGYLIEV